MKLLINICSHDGIISHYNGVGTMTLKYIQSFSEILSKKNINYEMNLFTPEYDACSFGYNDLVRLKHKNMVNTNIYEISNGSNKKVNYGDINNWKLLCINTSKIINSIDMSKYDKVITIYNDTPFCSLGCYLKKSQNHKKVLVLHSSVKIHKVDSAIKDSILGYNDRLQWELKGIDFVNNDPDSYYGSICNFFENHLINEYNLNKNKVINLSNGEIIDYNKKVIYSNETINLFNQIKDSESIIISYGRAEEYKNLEACFYLGKKLNIQSIVIAQLYYKEQPIKYVYEEISKSTAGKLYIDAPFDLPKYILTNFKGNIICLVPSKEEIMGLIVNEVRKLNKDNILLVANNIGGLAEQIENGIDGVLIDLNDLEKSKNDILKYFNKKDMKRINKSGFEKLCCKYDFNKIATRFLNDMIGE